jgi:hypothetical protein
MANAFSTKSYEYIQTSTPRPGVAQSTSHLTPAPLNIAFLPLSIDTHHKQSLSIVRKHSMLSARLLSKNSTQRFAKWNLLPTCML